MRLEDVLLRDTRANQPLATVVPVGTLYFVTDEGVTEQSDGATWLSYSAAAGGTGDVVGPASSVDDRIATFDGATGKLIQDGGTTIAALTALIPAAGITQLTGDVVAGPGSGSQVATLNNPYKAKIITLVVDGAGVVLTTGIKGFIQIPVNGTLIGWTLLADQAGAIVIDVWKDTYANYPPTNADSITNGIEPEIVATGIKATDSDLSDWTTQDVTAGDVLGFNIDSVASITKIVLELYMTVTI